MGSEMCIRDRVFQRPWLAIALVAVLLVTLGYFAQRFRLDVSADSLLMEGDTELEYSREVNQRYGVRDSVTVAFTPKNMDLISDRSLTIMSQIRQDLLAMERVESVDSLLNVPLFGDTPLTGISEDYDTLADEGVDREAARQELMNSPVFRNAIISPDGETSAMLVSFAADERYTELVNRRTELRNLAEEQELTEAQAEELQQVSETYDEYSVESAERRHRDIEEIRQILAEYQDEVTPVSYTHLTLPTNREV